MTLLIYCLVKALTGSKKKAFHHAIEWSALIYLVTNDFILRTYFSLNLSLLILLIMLIIFLLFIIFQWRLVGDIFIKRVCQLFLRATFLCQSLLNIGLVIVILIKSLIN